MADINKLIKVYLDDLFKVGANTELELEVKFGTRGIKSIDRLQYGQVIQGLLSHGFNAIGNNKYLLRIQNEYADVTTGEVRLSNLRTEINGLHNVQMYCKSNRLDSIVDGGLSYLQKETYKQNKTIIFLSGEICIVIQLKTIDILV